MPASSIYSLLNRKEHAHDDPIYCCIWTKTNTTGNSKDAGKDFIVTAGLDSLVKVWSLENNKLELFHTLKGHCMAVVSVAVSPDGHTLATSSLDFSLIIWELLTGIKVHEMKIGATDVWKIVFSPGGEHLLTGGHTGKLVIFDIVKNSTDKILDTRGKFALSVAWSKNGKYIASGSVDGTACVFDVSQSKIIHTIEAHTDTVRSVAFSPKSDMLATASNDGFVKLFDVASANLQCSLDFKCWVLNARFSDDGTRVAIATANGSVVVASITGLQVLNTFQEHSDLVWDVQFNPESNKLLSISKDKSLIIYECPVPAKEKKK